MDLSRFGVVIFAGGFRPDYRSWLPWPNAYDDLFLCTRKSSLLLGVGKDAMIVTGHIAAAKQKQRNSDGFLFMGVFLHVISE